MSLDLSLPTALLADAAARLLRLLPVRAIRPGLAGVLLRGAGNRLELHATDGEAAASVTLPALVHTDGEAVLSRRALADTLAHLDAPQLRVVVKGSRVALRTPGARFALPRLEPAPAAAADVPPALGTVPGAAFAAAAAAVAAAASREEALPLFTGVRLRSADGRLSLLATDRFRLAAAELPWQPAPAATRPVPAEAVPGGLDVLVPATLLAEVTRLCATADTVTLHGGDGRCALSWPGWTVTAPSLAAGFPDAQLRRLLEAEPAAEAVVDADELTQAVRRAALYAGPTGAVSLDLADGQLRVQGRDAQAGESEETLKADTSGDWLTRHYQSRFLLDALRPFAGGPVRLSLQPALRPTVFTAPTPAPDLRYLVVPLRRDPAS
ncbi:DNA polymerase III subunit beta [Catellatospora sp. KI3]|uniref:DNA polymerase III subunit beta n=1 Tax=Catellatospora sp. KI3 TaxID=3041620 RepID=UPI0024831E4A|nr:DNA polymerase III subunit beta [Catellatospora sp. KI3]MDI1462411.1 DNA polymerase III subunit beta [Catellatospora sp. KI3]